MDRKKEYLNYINSIIEYEKYENTYKMAWAKSIVEIIINEYQKEKVFVITFNQIAEKFLEYYWNEHFMGNYYQSRNLNSPPIIVTTVNTLIKEFCNSKFLMYDEIKNSLKEYKEYHKYLKIIKNTIRKDVWDRFNIVNEQEIHLYAFDDLNKPNIIYMNMEFCEVILENSDELVEKINSKWESIRNQFRQANLNDYEIEKVKYNENIEEKKVIKKETYNIDKKTLNSINRDSQGIINTKNDEKYEIDKFWIKIL